MNTWFFKLVVVVLLFLGEALSVYSEMIGAKAHSDALTAYPQIFIKSFLLITMAGALLITGYMLGYKSFKNIWIVSVMSITSILIMEPVIAYIILKQLPTKGATIGLILGAMGFIATFL